MKTRSVVLYGGLAVGATLLLSSCAVLQVGKAAQVATGVASHWMCDDVFIGGQDPDAAFSARAKPVLDRAKLGWLSRWTVDREAQQIKVSLAGAFVSRAQFQAGHGCHTLPASEPAPVFEAMPDTSVTTASQAPIAGEAPVHGVHPPLDAVLSEAIESERARAHRTKALLVLHRGRILSEHYAAGHGPDTPMLGFSMSKSVTSALIGALVQQGRLSPSASGALSQWRDPANPRHGITIEHLLRQTSGLDLRQDNSGFDPSTQIMYTVRDKADRAAEGPVIAKPGERWAYSDTNYLLLSRILRDTVGGSAKDVNAFAQQTLFGPLGMRHTSIDFDTTGTPVGAAHVNASPRDWARFGQLYLDRGLAGPVRILSESWVADSARPSLDTGYGMGFWTNRLGGELMPSWGVPWGLANAPIDSFFARGYMGQFIVVIPSEELVIVRMSTSHVQGDDIGETNRIVGWVRSAVRQ